MLIKVTDMQFRPTCVCYINPAQVACLRETNYYKKEGASYILSLSSQAVVALTTEDAMKVAQALGSTL